jgi:hypothetical protein
VCLSSVNNSCAIAPQRVNKIERVCLRDLCRTPLVLGIPLHESCNRSASIRSVPRSFARDGHAMSSSFFGCTGCVGASASRIRTLSARRASCKAIHSSPSVWLCSLSRAEIALSATLIFTTKESNGARKASRTAFCQILQVLIHEPPRGEIKRPCSLVAFGYPP